MTEFNTAYPSIRKIQNHVKDNTAMEIKLLTNDVVTGKLLWQDPHAICLALAADGGDKEMIVFRQAIAYIKTQA
ncbi:MAG: RNA-binding protein hfq [Limnothrix sp.]